MMNIDKYKLKYYILEYSITYLLAFSPLILFGIAVIISSFSSYLSGMTVIISFFLLLLTLTNIEKIKGIIGETITRVIIQSYCEDSKYINMHNLLLENKVLGYSQIDHIVFTTKGIAVIETKYHLNYKIYGSEYDNKWTYKHRKGFTNQRPNPMKQNYGHIQALKEIINDDSISYYNIVSYVDVSKIEKCDLVNKNSKCIYTYDLPKTIKELVENDNTEKIGITKMSEIICKIRDAEIKDRKIKRNHIKKLKEKHN